MLRQQEFADRVRSASEERVAAGLRRCSERLERGTWLDASSALAGDAEAVIKSSSNADLDTLAEELDEYAAASAVLHCTDGWNYLGRALSCLCAGVLSEAVHLLYYSEVRSAMALMNASGLLVTGQQSVALGRDGTRTIRSGSTHDLVWHLLEEWAASPTTIQRVGESLMFEQQSLERWVRASNRGTSDAAIVSLLTLWGMDLKNFEGDRDRRNWAAYRPGSLVVEDLVGLPLWVRDLVVELDSMLEPGPKGSFPLLDSALIRHILSPKVTARGAAATPDLQFGRALTISSQLYSSGYQAERVANLLVQNDYPNSNLVAAAATATSKEYVASRSDIVSMMGRALILARLSTGFVMSLTKQAGLDGTQLEPWVNHVGVRQGYWIPSPRPDLLTDMWEDISMAIEDLRALKLEDERGVQKLQHQNPLSTKFATGVTRTLLWNIGA